MTCTARANPLNPLLFLANVISDEVGYDTSTRHLSSSSDSSSKPSSPISPSSCSPLYLQDLTSLHVSPVPTKVQDTRQRILRHSTSSNRPPADPNFVQFIRHKSGKKAQRTTDSQLKNRMQMKKRRKELLEKAMGIKSLDNSPVNERQLLVLRMVYDEITMYPCESWMVLIAIIIHR